MALALPSPTPLTGPMAPSNLPASPRRTPPIDCRIVISGSEPRTHTHLDALHRYEESSSPLSPAESDEDTPISPITFGRNETYERSRLSFYIAPAPRPSSTPSSPQGELSPISPVVFAHPNASSPSLCAAAPPPVFPNAGTQSLALRLRRPLPPLPSPDTDGGEDGDSGATPLRAARGGPSDTRPPHQHQHQHQQPPFRAPSRASTQPSPASSDGRDGDSVADLFSFSPTPSSAQSPATSLSDSPASSRDPFLAFASHLHSGPADPKPRCTPLAIPGRSHSTPLPLPQSAMPPLIGRPILELSPCIAVTPASPGPAQQFGFPPAPSLTLTMHRSASATSVVLPSPAHDGAHTQPFHPQSLPTSLARAATPDRERALPRAPSPDPEDDVEYVDALDPAPLHYIPERATSPAPSLSPSVASGRSFASAGRSLRRIASKTRLFGRRTLSTASEPWEAAVRTDRSDRSGGGRGKGSSKSSSSLDEGASTGDEDETVVGHSLDRLRSASPASTHTLASGSGSDGGGKSSADGGRPAGPMGARRLEVTELVVTPEGEVWEARELYDVIPKLRQLRAPSRLRV